MDFFVERNLGAMKIVKTIQKHREMSEEDIKNFIYRNFPDELIRGLEYDEPKAMMRALKLLGIKAAPPPADLEDETSIGA